MAKLLLCFKPFGSAEDISEVPRRVAHPGSGPPHSPGRHALQDTHRTVAFVELLKHTNEPLGLALEGGADRDVLVYVGALRPGGVAEKSGALQLGDHILSINGTATERLTHNEVNALLENAGNVINLEIAFESPNGAEPDDSTMKKRATIKLPRDRESLTSYGFTISGGKNENRPITVSNVTVGSAAYRQGILKAGDRILKVNGVDVSHASQMETHSLLKTGEGTCTLEVEYDVTLHDGLAEATSALLVELLKPKGVSLGLSLRESLLRGAPLLISRIKEAGIADRCGALHVGDRLLSVGGVSLENKHIEEVNQMLKKCDLHVQLEIVPGHNYPDEEEILAVGESVSRLSHLPLSTSQLSGAQSQLSLASTATSTGHLVSHPETMEVTLKADDYGFGLSLQGGATELINYPLIIANIEEHGPAAKLGQLQIGDQILAINRVQTEGVTLQQAVKLVQEASDVVEMEVMFNVNDAIVPTSGTFEVTMQRTSTLTLGITINGSHRQGDTIWISNLKKGGIASRMGMLQSGDVLLAVNGESLDQATLRDAAKMLRNAGDVVTLTVSKESATAVPMPRKPEPIIYSVELHRNNQSLGITLTGNKDRGGYPTISRIKEDGVAHKTGTLKVGDKVLAINGETLYDKTVSDAVRILQAAGDVVTLRISKSTKRQRSRPKASSPTGKARHHKDFNSFHRGFASRMGGGGGSSRMSPLNGFNRYGPGRSLHHHHHHHHPPQLRQLSQESFSGWSTPDNQSFVSLSRYAGDGLHSPDASGEHDDVLDRLTPSEADSSYTPHPPPSAYSGVPHSSRVWSYLQDHHHHHQLLGSPRSPPSLSGAYPHPGAGGGPLPPPSSSPPSSSSPSAAVGPHHQPPRSLRPNPYSAPQLRPHEFHHQGEMMSSTNPATTPDGLPNGSALNDVDEELSSYHELSSSRRDTGYRRTSLPVYSSASGMMPVGYTGSPTTPTAAITTANANANATESSNKKWDFKYPRSRRGYGRGKGAGDSKGRMSPYASSDLGRFTPTTSPYPNHLEDSLLEHGHSARVGGPAVAADPVKKPGGVARTKRSSSRSPVKLSSPVPIEGSPPHSHSHPYHHSPQSPPHKPHPHTDSYDDEDDPDNGAKAASGGSRCGSKLSSSLGSRSDEERQGNYGLVTSTGGGDRDGESSYAFTEPSLPEKGTTTSRSSLRLNLALMQPPPSSSPLPPYEQNHPPPHTVHSSQHPQQQQKHQYHQPLAVEQKLRSQGLHTTEDVVDRSGKTHQLHSSGPSSPVRFVNGVSSSSLDHTQPDSQDSADSENQIPAIPATTRGYEVRPKKLELAHNVRHSPTRPVVASELGSPMADVGLNGNGSSPSRKKSTASLHSNGSGTPGNKSGSNISPTGNISGSLTHKGGPLATTGTTASSGMDSLQRTTTQGALSESALKSLNGIKQSINKAITFEQELKALAESGSSDQDSDSEPHASQGLMAIPPHEQQKISDKMKTAVPPQQIVVRLTKPPTTSSFGFSVADGQYDLGVYVKAVKPGGPADGSDGLRSYDRIVKVNNREITSEVNCKTILPLFKEGDELTLLVARSPAGLIREPFQ